MSEVTLYISDENTKELCKLSCSKNFYGALLVMTGKFGTGKERENGLTAAGFDAKGVQLTVNEIVGVI